MEIFLSILFILGLVGFTALTCLFGAHKEEIWEAIIKRMK